VPSKADLSNCLVHVKLMELEGEGLRGEVLS
jgi:hypothetical protein